MLFMKFFFKKSLAFLIAALMLVSFCGCKKNKADDLYSEYIVNENGEIVKEDGTKVESKESKSGKQTNSKGTKASNSNTTTAEDDFMDTLDIENYTKKNKSLESRVKELQNAISALGGSYPALSLSKVKGSTKEKAKALKGNNTALNQAVTSLTNTLVTLGRNSVKNGVTGDLNSAYSWAKTAFSGKKLIALTFDDHPAEITSYLLDGLKSRNVAAVFFVIGRNIKANSNSSALLTRMKNEGHVIGNHTQNHIPLYRKYITNTTTVLDPVKEVTDCSNLIKQNAGGYNSFLLRVPGFIYKTPSSLPAGAEPNGIYNPASLSRDTKNFLVDSTQIKVNEGADTETVYNQLLSAKDGSIIIIHPKYNLVDAAFKLIDKYKDDGYEFVTVPELIMAKAGKIEYAKAYRTPTEFANIG